MLRGPVFEPRDTRRRKTLANALRAYRDATLTPDQALALTGLSAERRPETLTIAELVQLADAYSGGV